ncbi:hypothetical protein R0135_05655 [Congregibacter variabilis]|uniref:Uncharacterized protein n=1 Tax=Congregibacter variabilis TaxID=3081200 RepID=A0ABZ0I743_9GAMM|nr:hypothetical protein R0135_05655 [Congregibacter sp. IMCC43200]
MSELEDKLRSRASAPELPILRLQEWSRLPSWAFGALCGLLVAGCLLSPVFTTEVSAATFNDVLASALFFGTSLGILAGFSRPVFAGAAQDIRQLSGVLSWSEASIATASTALSRIDRANLWRACILGCTLGVAHSYILNSHLSPLKFAIPQIGGTILLWVAMFLTVPPLIVNALVFSSLGQIAKPDLLRPSRHAAFGSAALRPALLMTGMLCAYSLLFLGGDNPLDGPVIIGVIAGLVPLIGIVARPLRGIRRRIREERQQTLTGLDARLDRITQGDIAGADADTLFQLDAVLDMRERVARAPSWPFDVHALKRMLLYTVLPPLTWAAAAFVEIMIDKLL